MTQAYFTSVTERGQNEVDHFSEGSNSKTLAPTAKVTIGVK